MKQPFYKKWLSYFQEVHIESTASDYNEILDLYLVKGRYQLCTKNAIYSFADKYDNFARVFQNMNFDNIDNVLVLGLGLASIPYMLENNFNQQLSYTGVEIDEEVVYLASKYVLDELKSEMEVITTDAYTFLSLTENRYDMICMDVFIDDVIPEELESIDFLEMLKETLTNKGLLIYNRLALTGKDVEATDKFYNEVFTKVFEQATIFQTGGNKMLLNRPLNNN